jgi:hypothetical protein
MITLTNILGVNTNTNKVKNNRIVTTNTDLNVASDNDGDWKIAVIDADEMLNDLMTDLGFKGDSLGEVGEEFGAGGKVAPKAPPAAQMAAPRPAAPRPAQAPVASAAPKPPAPRPTVAGLPAPRAPIPVRK